MRDFKFRAWSIDDKHFVYFNIWDLILGSVADTLTEETIIEQSTTKQDRNGKDIYEGDIVKIIIHDWDEDVACYGIVVWDDDELRFDIEWYEGLTSDAWKEVNNHNAWHKVLVVGNKFENKDLLGEVLRK